MDATSTTPRQPRRPLAGDEQLDEWRPLLIAWWSRFGDEPVTVNDLRVALCLDTPHHTLPIPSSLRRPRRMGPGALKRSLGRRLSALVGWTIGPFVVCDAGEDSHVHVRRWRLQCVQPGTQQPGAAQ